MTEHEVTCGVAPRVAPRSGSPEGLPWEPSRKNCFISVQPPKLLDWTSVPCSHFFRFQGNLKLRSKGKD